MQMSCIAALVAVAGSLAEGVRVKTQSHVNAYEAFRQDFGIDRPNDDVAYHHRVALFAKRAEEVKRHNARADKSWVAGLNKFADFTDDEFRAMLGHKPSWRSRGVGAAGDSFLELQPSKDEMQQSVDWRSKLNASASPKDQGGCGSCWAVAAAGALETRAEAVTSKGLEISFEQLVDCVPNPDECGGSGGCKGATTELAFQYVKEHGLGRKSDYKGYQSGGDGKCKPPANAALTVKDFTRLPVNKLDPLMLAVAEGPVAVSADANGWGAYQSGVFDGCGKDAVINHAILLMGYGTDEAQTTNKDYWLIRNSWGDLWGEKGFIRLKRHASDEGDAGYCGTDRNPLEGVGCKGGPAEMPVCGMCGILSDSAYPSGVEIVSTSSA